jgi:hypothetical protein
MIVNLINIMAASPERSHALLLYCTTPRGKPRGILKLKTMKVYYFENGHTGATIAATIPFFSKDCSSGCNPTSIIDVTTTSQNEEEFYGEAEADCNSENCVIDDANIYQVRVDLNHTNGNLRFRSVEIDYDVDVPD